MLFAFMLKPMCDRIEKVFANRVVAILLTLLVVGLLIGGIFTFFFIRISDVLNEADDIIATLSSATNTIIKSGGKLLGMNAREASKMVTNGFANFLKEPITILSSGLSTSGLLIGNFFLVIIYTFFFLLYSTAFKRFTLGQFRDSAQAEGEVTIREIQHVASDYLGGMLTVMLVLGVLNSTGLYLIGIQYPLVWGFLGAMLAVIPYVGTTLGGLLPLLYAIATTTTFWQPAAVVVLYGTVQFVEGNLITPKIVGNSVKINALAAILSLILGLAFWGLAGLILAIPLLAMLRIVLDHLTPLKPVALLLSDDLYEHSDLYLTEYHKPEYRLYNLFKSRKVVLEATRPRLTRQPAHGVGKADPQVIPDPETQEGDGDTRRE
jgi:predicted PurR-regulated permease PerM